MGRVASKDYSHVKNVVALPLSSTPGLLLQALLAILVVYLTLLRVRQGLVGCGAGPQAQASVLAVQLLGQQQRSVGLPLLISANFLAATFFSSSVPVILSWRWQGDRIE